MMPKITFQYCSFYTENVEEFKHKIITYIRESIYLTATERLELIPPKEFGEIILGEIAPGPPLMKELKYYLFDFFHYKNEYELVRAVRQLDIEYNPNIVIQIICDFAGFSRIQGVERL